MNKSSFKKIISIIMCVFLLALSVAGCDKKEADKPANDPPKKTEEPKEKKPEDFTGTLVVWHFNKDEAPVLVKEFTDKYPNVKVELQVTADTDLGYQNKVTAALRSGTGLPDVLFAENAFAKRFVSMTGLFEDISQAPYNAESYTGKSIPYTVDIGKSSDGKIRALTYQACPGGIGYKRDLAKQYLGTDDPKALAEMLSTPEKMLETARTLKKASNGKVKLWVGTEDLYKVYVGSRQDPWIKDGKLVIDPKMMEFIDLSKKLRDEKLEGGIRQWTPAWSAAVADSVNMCYAIPTWGVQWIVAVNDKANADKGRWGITTVDSMSFYEGGTWVGMTQQSKNKELAWEFVKFLTTDAENMKAHAKATGDFVNNTDIINELTNDPSFVNKTVNENTYKLYGPAVDKINGSLITQYDDTIRKTFTDTMQTFLAGKIDKDTFIKQFKEAVKANIQDIIVE